MFCHEKNFIKNTLTKTKQNKPESGSFTRMGLNLVTLSFSDDNEERFLSRYFQDSLIQFRVSFVLVIALYAAFGYLDTLVVPHLVGTFWTIRYVFVVPTLLVTLALSFTSIFRKIWQQLLFVSFLVAGLGITIMTVKAPDNYAYYAGLMLIFSAGYFFIKLRFFMASMAGWITLAGYNIGAFFFADIDTGMIINNNFFYFSANVIGMFASYYIEYYARRDFYLNQQLDRQKHEVEQANKNLELNVEIRTKQLKEAKERAEQSDRLKSAFLANMSHEIRTPMNGIIGFSDLLPTVENQDELQEYINIIQQNGQLLLALINDILDLSKIEAGVLTLSTSEFPVNVLIREICDLFKTNENVIAKNLVIQSSVIDKSDDLIIRADRTRLKQVLINLMSNACKYTDKGFVKIGCEVQSSDLIFYVKDSGSGMNETQKQVVFERFMQVITDDKPRHDGSGLGLAISKAFVKLFGGEIWVESEPGIGSIFSFNLPLQMGIKTGSEFNFNKMSEMEYNWKDKVILVAEDVSTNFLLVKKSLKKTEVALLWSKNGQEAVEECKNNPSIDLVLMDIRMPVMNGLEATRKIKEMRPDLPIIAQTAYAMDGDREKSLDAGCDDYISKPINLREFTEMIAAFLEK